MRKQMLIFGVGTMQMSGFDAVGLQQTLKADQLAKLAFQVQLIAFRRYHVNVAGAAGKCGVKSIEIELAKVKMSHKDFLSGEPRKTRHGDTQAIACA